MKKKKIPFQKKKQTIYSYALACFTKLFLQDGRLMELFLLIFNINVNFLLRIRKNKMP